MSGNEALFEKVKALSSGLLLVITAPSGVGKNHVHTSLYGTSWGRLNSARRTQTRPMRQNETHGKEYYFVTESFFQEKTKEDFFLEWAKVHGDYYGTSYQEVLGPVGAGEEGYFGH